MMTRAGLAVALLALAPPSRAAFDPDEDRALRIASETGFGVLAGSAGFFSGALIGYGVCALAGEDQGMFGCLGGALIGGFAGAFAGIGLGVYGGGELLDANGGLGWTYLGETAGLAVSGAIVFAAEIDVGEIGGLLLLSAGPLIGAILGYELSTSREGTRTIGGSLRLGF